MSTTTPITDSQKITLETLLNEYGGGTAPANKFHHAVLKALSARELVIAKETKKDGKMVRISAKGKKALN